jgi:O-antigen/teichoic acid export membrane protein
MKKAIKMVSLLWLGSLFSAVCTFLTQLLLAKKLDPTFYGTLSSALAITTLFAPLAGFGISQCWLKAFGREGLQAMRWLPASFRFVSFSTFAVIVLLISWAKFGIHEAVTSKILMILSFYVLSQPVMELVGSKLQLEERYWSLIIWQILPNFTRLAFIFLLIYTSVNFINVQNVAYIYSGVAVILFIIGVWILHRMHHGYFALKGHSEIVSNKNLVPLVTPSIAQIATQSWPSGLAGLFYLIYFQGVLLLFYHF